MNYEALLLMSAAVWRIIGAVREPVLYPLRALLVKYSADYGKQIFGTIVWLVAFLIGYGYATMAGANGDMLEGLGWTDGYQEIGWAMTAIAIASGSAGLRAAEKLWDGKTDNAPE
jgi:hypothetical protein